MPDHPVDFSLSCPLPDSRHTRILLAHGGGGTLMHQLIERIFVPAFQGQPAGPLHDGAVLELRDRLAFTTDSYVVNPLFFPGGDIGKLAVCGTVNDLAMCGARPLCLSAGFILEEGFPIEDLRRIARSMREAADEAKVAIVTGDTKVVDRGKGDGLYINTAGIGLVAEGVRISPAAVRPGDVVLLNGDVGRHGVAILAAREGFQIETRLESDCAPLADAVLHLLDAGIEIHCLRDCTRGGLATTLVEIARDARLQIEIAEAAVPVLEETRGICEILGFDPLYVANEGRFAAFVAPADADRALDLLRAHPQGAGAGRIGVVSPDPSGLVVLQSGFGSGRILDMLSGEQLPRIC
ncbi:MAG: hydrogenase expression/formation protein HypE [Candidatus Sumerlaeota bacterium]|nr:hydrogenase expression/formation protein HypE [Candidatus Sumerlaeota bacterium]